MSLSTFCLYSHWVFGQTHLPSQQRMRWWDSSIDSMDMNLSKLWEIISNREAWQATVHGVAKSQTQLSNWTTKTFSFPALVGRRVLIIGCFFQMSFQVNPIPHPTPHQDDLGPPPVPLQHLCPSQIPLYCSYLCYLWGHFIHFHSPRKCHDAWKAVNI